MSHNPKKPALYVLAAALLILSLACSVSGNGGATEEPPPRPPTNTHVPIPPTDTPAPPEPSFADAVGDWESTDIDGSYQTITITQNSDGTFSIDYYDDGATICGLASDGTILYPATLEGTGTATGLALDVSLSITCHGDTDFAEGPVSVTFTYDAAADTIVDSIGVAWTRLP